MNSQRSRQGGSLGNDRDGRQELPFIPANNDAISPVMKRQQLISGQTGESAKLVG
jgi:hypothetical protein